MTDWKPRHLEPGFLTQARQGPEGEGSRVAPQVGVVAEVFVSQGNAGDALRHQCPHRMFDETLVPVVREARTGMPLTSSGRFPANSSLREGGFRAWPARRRPLCGAWRASPWRPS